MTKDVVIKVEGISKKYAIGSREAYLTLRDRIIELPRKLFKREKAKEFWALKDVSFEVKRGEVVGIIGRNGAGKSTLLKILARITEPTSGRVTMKGRVASMLEVGTGFNPELTGRENIYLNGSILGMSRREIESKFKEIIDFSGVEKFIDSPVKHYSSGMYVRLAFAVAAHLDTDILLVDEVLAVGDAEFQKKCLGKTNSLAGKGKTVIFVSHDIAMINSLCSNVILLDKGFIISSGRSQTILDRYIRQIRGLSRHDLSKRTDRSGNGLVRINKIILDESSKPLIKTGNPWKFVIMLNKDISIYHSFHIILGIYNQENVSVIRIDSGNIRTQYYKNKILITTDSINLAPTTLTVNLALYIDSNLSDYIGSALTISIHPEQNFRYSDDKSAILLSKSKVLYDL